MVKLMDCLYLEAMQKLTAKGLIQIASENLIKLENNSQRTLFIYDILKGLNLLPKVISVPKSEALSNKSRQLGNECFKNHNYYQALQYYNLSLMHAPNDSNQLSLAYANRSAVLHSMKHYEECLKDIEKVLSLPCPSTIRQKLLDRKQLCLQAKESEKNDTSVDANNVLIAMPGRNAIYPCASSKLAVRYTPEMGRHVVATQDIAPGEILAIEEPYARYLLKPKALLHCDHCFSHSANLLPCGNCCTVLYCSEKCKENARKEYHSAECEIGATLAAMDFAKLELMALRIVIRARTDQPDWETLINLVKRADETPNTDNATSFSHYESVHRLSTNIEHRSVSDVFQKGVTAAVLLHLLITTQFVAERDARECVAGLLLRHIMSCCTNAHSVNATLQEKNGRCVQSCDIGSALYAFLSLVNHSCAPNAVHFTNLGTATATLVSLRKTSKGAQIFDTYGMVHSLNTKKERQEWLSSRYKFNCRCEACSGEWGEANSQKTSDMSLISPDTLTSLRNGCVRTAVACFRPLCELAERFEGDVSSPGFNDLLEAIKQCGFILFGVLPCGHSDTVDWRGILMGNV